MELALTFMLGILAQYLVISSAHRMNEYLPKTTLYKRSMLSEKTKRFFFMSDIRSKKEYLTLGIVFVILAVLSIFVSIVFFLIAILTENATLDFWSVVVSFVLMASGTLVVIAEMLVFFAEEIKKNQKNKE